MKKIFVLLILIFMVNLPLFAGTTGKLAGKVTDNEGNPIPFANIILEGTEIGAQTKENGTYIIINISPGKYNVFCSRGGYGTAKVTGVRINLDLTTMQNFTLSKQAVEIEGYDVTEARVEMVQDTKTSSGRTITSEAMEDIAVESLEDIIAIQAGVTITGGELHIRGGRANEVVYTIDGMSVSDPVDGGSALTVDMDAVEITDVKTGGFTAEYGNAQSGIVNIITKSGSRDYSGKIEFISDHLIPGTDNSNSDEIKFNLGGPVFSPLISSLRDKFTFFINGTANWHDTRYHDYYVSDPNEELRYLISTFSTSDPYADRDDFIGFDLGNRNYNVYNMNAKFKYKFNAKQNLTFAIRGDKNIFKAFSYSWKYALDHYAIGESTQKQFAATYDHTFNPQMNMKVKASYYTKELVQSPDGIDRDEYFILDPDNFELYDPNEIGKCTGIIYLTNDGLIGPDSELLWTIMSDVKEKGMGTFSNFVHPARIYGFNADDENSVATFRTDFEYQLNEIHGFKTGLEITKHNIRKDRLVNPWVIDEYRYSYYLETYCEPDTFIWNEVIEDSVAVYGLDDIYAATLAAAGESDGYKANPWQAAYYLQDKMEWEGMIVNAGLRFDFWYLGEKYKILQDSGEFVWEEFDKDERMQMMISPRLGVSHPISETAVMHFAYNYQNQLPQMQYIFTTARPEDAITSASAIVVGKPNLEPQITVTYEVGLQKQLGEDYVMDIQAYYKNIYNYVSTREVVDPVNTNVTWFEYISEDYGSARGIDINLEKRLSNFIMGSASYSLSWANGNSSDTVIQSETMSLREFPLDWDIRHNFSLNVTFRVSKGEEFYVPFTDFALPIVVTDDFAMNMFFNIASGTPYTPTTITGTPFDTNSKNKPYTTYTNFRITKKFAFTEKSAIKVYMNIQNLFDKKNINWVYSYTGS
ncbi:MAG: TonB-dependent receptor, partial [Candidatus Cloacimonetes bacterium]|nr:TonB-dependent receptor [Candidatus Cloacimonadota bacterium]